jgi:hypothetical protein
LNFSSIFHRLGNIIDQEKIKLSKKVKKKLKRKRTPKKWGVQRLDD